MTDLAQLDATALAALVASGEASPRELVQHSIAAIENLNPQLNAVIHERFDRALDEAPDAPDGPFTGVPFLVKDAVCHTEGDPFHAGMQVLKDAGWTADSDTWLAQRFRAAGFLIVGKTNTPELASTVTTEPLAYGATHNPWNLDFSTGGSSGGSAAAVAAGLVPVAHGNDMGGSIRFPASCCGLVGLKPTRARTTLGPDFGEYWGPVTHEHVLTRTVRDTAGVLDAIAGPGVGDPYTAPPPTRPFASEVGADPGQLRVGVRTTRPGGMGESDPECVTAVNDAIAALERAGHIVESDEFAGLDHPGLGEALPVAWSAVVARDVERWSQLIGRTIQPHELEPMNALLVEMAAAFSATQWLAALEALQQYARAIARDCERFDVMLTPTISDPPLRLGELAPEADEPLSLLLRAGALTAFTMPFNITGQPAISLPIRRSTDGLPIGVQLVAPQGREDVLIRVASQLEAEGALDTARPPIFAP
jgi:amidase